MNCRFCQQECQPITPHLLPNGLYENRIARCNPCNVDYFKGFYSVNCTLNSKDYYVLYSYDHPKHWTSVGCDQGSKIALQFYQHVEFTPKNIKEKLKLYLLFS